MKLSIATAPLLIAPFLLASCSFPNVSPAQTQQVGVTTQSIPDSLGFQAPTGTGLAAADRTTLASAVAVNPTLAAPTSAALFLALFPYKDLFLADPASLTPPQSQETAALKALADQNPYNLLTSYQQNCYLNKSPAPAATTNMPVEGWNFDFLQVGDQLTNSSAYTLNQWPGTTTACPIGLSGSFSNTLSVAAIDHTAKSATYNFSNAPSTNLQLSVNSTYAAAFGANGISLSSSATGLTMVQVADPTKNASSTNLTFSLHGTFSGLTATVPFTLTVQSLNKAMADKSGSTETVLTTNVQASVIGIVTVHKLISIASNGTQTVITNDIWLNGLKTTQQDLYNLFGDSSQIMVGNVDIINNLTVR